MKLLKIHRLMRRPEFSKEGREKMYQKACVKAKKGFIDLIKDWANLKPDKKESVKGGMFGKKNKSIPNGYDFTDLDIKV